MKRGSIRQITWGQPPGGGSRRTVANRGLRGRARDEAGFAPAPSGVEAQDSPRITPAPKDAVEEAHVLLRIAAEVEGALTVQYLYAAYSVLPGLSLDLPGIDHPVLSDDWYEVIRQIAKQEMGHLITVQNLLLSLNAPPHLDRENFPWTRSELYPFPFHLEPLGLYPLAKDVAAEAPKNVRAADLADYQDALQRANAVAGEVSRVGKIYERLYWLFQDGDGAQAPWNTVVNPFPDWPNWHIPPERVGFNQDRQAQPGEWRGDDASVPPDTAIYVLPAADKASARNAIFQVARQGEGPADAGEIMTHFDKFLRLYREFRAYSQQAGAPAFIRNQAADPTTGTGGAAGAITDQTTLAWAQLANVRYRMLLLDIVLSLSVGMTGSVPGTTAGRRDFLAWAIGTEMVKSIKKIAEELRTMPLKADAPADSVRAGLPFELPSEYDLPTATPEQVAELRNLATQSQTLCKTIRDKFNPTPKQQMLLAALENTDASIAQKIGPAGPVPHTSPPAPSRRRQ